MLGLVVGVAVSIFFFLQPDLKPVPFHEGLYGLAANVLILVTLSLLIGRPTTLQKEALNLIQKQ